MHAVGMSKIFGEVLEQPLEGQPAVIMKGDIVSYPVGVNDAKEAHDILDSRIDAMIRPAIHDALDICYLKDLKTEKLLFLDDRVIFQTPSRFWEICSSLTASCLPVAIVTKFLASHSQSRR